MLCKPPGAVYVASYEEPLDQSDRWKLFDTQGRWRFCGKFLWGLFLTRRLAMLRRRVKKSPHKNLPQNAPSSLCVRLKQVIVCDIELFFIEEMWRLFIMGRGRKGLTEQSQRKHKHLYSQRGMSYIVFTKNREEKKMPIPENVVDFMKSMNPQQLVDFLLPNEDDWYVKTSSGNASGN